MASDGASGFVSLDAVTVRPAGPVDVQVKERYDTMAQTGTSNLCCAPQRVYSADDLASIPSWVLELSSGCGSPVTSLSLQPGQTVVDLGCGAGLDLLLAARRVGDEGQVIGVEASSTMVANARRAATESGFANIDVRVGDIRRPPVRPASVDVVLSNCVLSMFEDKAVVLRGMAAMLRPGGYAVISDVVYTSEVPDSDVTVEDGATGDDYARCVVGMTADQYRDLVLSAGFETVDIRDDGVVSYRDGAEVTSATILAYKTVKPGETACC
jgi:arsenite methyltransferase